jgi:uncharacterized membrane protein
VETRIRLFGHAVHQALVHFPIGILCGSAIFDVVWLFTGDPQWANVSYYMIVVGVISGLVASIAGLWDYLDIPVQTRARSVGFTHAVISACSLLVFALAWFVRYRTAHIPDVLALSLSFGGVAIVSVAGWYGGELVARHGIGVADDAGLDAERSITTTLSREATEKA